MPYSATVFKVMIASPSDVREEKGIVREAIGRWNNLHSETAKIVLLPISWETHSAPAFGDRPQGIINKQVLEKCDLLVAIFWTRAGTPTGREISGTIEEIKEHRKLGKPVMVYFSSAAVNPNEFDQNQYNLLKEFKEWCRGQAITGSYKDTGEFRELFFNHLVQTVNENDYFKERAANINIAAEIAAEPVLTKEARELLLEAVQDSGGTVMHVRYMGGVDVQTNGKNMITNSDPLTVAIWEGAVNELAELGLIEDRGYKGEVFRVTRAGYELADRLKNMQ